jgi:hypothetical protein
MCSNEYASKLKLHNSSQRNDIRSKFDKLAQDSEIRDTILKFHRPSMHDSSLNKYSDLSFTLRDAKGHYKNIMVRVDLNKQVCT